MSNGYSIDINLAYADALAKFQTDLRSSARQWGRDMETLFGEAMGKGFQYGISKGMRGSELKDYIEKNFSSAFQTFQRAMASGDQQGALRAAREIQRLNEQLTGELQKQHAAVEKMTNLRMKDVAQMMESSAASFQKWMKQSAPEQISTAIGGAGKKLGGLGDLASGLTGEQGVLGQFNSALGKTGKFLGVAGKALGAFGAIVGTTGKAVEAFADLEKQIKGMNRALLEGAGVGDTGLSSVEYRAGELTKKLTEIRKETSAVNENFMNFRATAQEQNKILATLNRAGYTYARMDEDIKKGNDLLQNRSDITAIALTYSRNLGVESTQMAQDMGTFADVTGQSLDEVAKSFSMIQREAMMGGFMTKRFYSAVMEATSGMAFYGVQVAETSELLAHMDSALGEAAGTEVFRNIAQEGAKSYQDSLREFLIKGGEGEMKEMFGTVYKQRLAETERVFEGRLGGDTVESLLKKSGGDAAKLRMLLTERGVRGQEQTDIAQLLKLQRASSEGGGLAAMMAARNAAGPAFEAVLKLRGMKEMGMGETIGEIRQTALERKDEGAMIALEQLATAQGKSFEQLLELDDSLRADFQLMKKAADAGEEVPEELRKLGYSIQYAQDGTAQIIKHSLAENGTIVADSGVEVKDHLDMLLTRPTEDGEQLQEQLTRDQEIAKEISSEITGLSEILEQVTNMILERIYDGVMDMAGFLATDDDQKRLLAQTEAAHQAQERAKSEAQSARQTERQAKKELESAKASGDQKKIADAEAKWRDAQKKADHTQRTLAQKTRAEGAVGGLSAEERAGEGLGIGKVAQKMGVGEKRAGEFAKKFEESLFRTDTEVGLGAGEEISLGALWDQVGSELNATRTNLITFMDGAADMSEWVKDDMRDAGLFEQIRGGEAGAQAAFEAAEKAYSAAGGDDLFKSMATEQEAVEAYNATLAAELGGLIMSDEEMSEGEKLVTETEKQTKVLEEIRDQEEEDGGSLWGRIFDDVIIPSGGGQPIIPNKRDTIMAFKPGGPIAGAMDSIFSSAASASGGTATVGAAGAGGGGSGAVSINIYGGDQKKVYDTVMRVMKVLGHA